jgi:hypothetical protein
MNIDINVNFIYNRSLDFYQDILFWLAGKLKGLTDSGRLCRVGL